MNDIDLFTNASHQGKYERLLEKVSEIYAALKTGKQVADLDDFDRSDYQIQSKLVRFSTTPPSCTI